jgi:uridine kinase
VAASTRTAAPDSILLFDGVFLLRPELADLWDFSIFVDVSFEETRRRAAERDATRFGSPEATLRRYAARYVPGQQLYFAEARPQEAADVVVENADFDHPTLRPSPPLDR